MSVSVQFMLAVCVLCVMLRQGFSTECCEGCQEYYTGTKSHLVAVSQTKTRYILMSYSCSRVWRGGDVCYKYSHRVAVSQGTRTKYMRVSYRCSFRWSRNVCYKYRLVYYLDKTYRQVYCRSVGMRCKPGCGP